MEKFLTVIVCRLTPTLEKDRETAGCVENPSTRVLAYVASVPKYVLNDRVRFPFVVYIKAFVQPQSKKSFQHHLREGFEEWVKDKVSSDCVVLVDESSVQAVRNMVFELRPTLFVKLMVADAKAKALGFELKRLVIAKTPESKVCSVFYGKILKGLVA